MLDLIWVALFKDGNILRQFDDVDAQAGEHAFQEVLDRTEELAGFALLNVRTNAIYSVNLLNGTFSTSNGQMMEQLLADEDMLRDSSCKYRLIYFRRVTRTFSHLDLKNASSPVITYFLGFQYNDADGRNFKRMVKISGDGRLVSN